MAASTVSPERTAPLVGDGADADTAAGRRPSRRTLPRIKTGGTHRMMRWWSQAVGFLSISGMLVAMVLLGVEWWTNNTLRSGAGIDELFLAVVSLTTLLAVFALWRYHYFADVVEKESQTNPSRFEPSLLLFTETAVLLVHPLPFIVDTEEELVGLCMFMVVRLYFLARTFRDVNPEYRSASALTGFCDLMDNGFTFALRSCFYRQPWVLLLTLFVGGSFLSSVFIWAAEREVQNVSLTECFWLTAVTMTTVGYGDITPKSTLGRLMSALTCFYGICVIALCVATVTKEFNLTDRQRVLVNRIHNAKAFEARRNAAARLIQHSWRRSGSKVRNKLVQRAKATRLSCRYLQQDLSEATFQQDVLERLDTLARAQEAILARLAKLEGGTTPVHVMM
jgi:hypothetical protein